MMMMDDDDDDDDGDDAVCFGHKIFTVLIFI